MSPRVPPESPKGRSKGITEDPNRGRGPKRGSVEEGGSTISADPINVSPVSHGKTVFVVEGSQAKKVRELVTESDPLGVPVSKIIMPILSDRNPTGKKRFFSEGVPTLSSRNARASMEDTPKKVDKEKSPPKETVSKKTTGTKAAKPLDVPGAELLQPEALKKEILSRNPEIKDPENLTEGLTEVIQKLNDALNDQVEIRKIQGKPVQLSFEIDRDNLIISYEINGRTRQKKIRIMGFDRSWKLDRDYHSHELLLNRSYEDSKGVIAEFERAIEDIQGTTQLIRNAENGFGWDLSENNPDLLSFEQLPEVGVHISQPMETVTFYKGFRADSLQEMIAIAEQGLLSKHHSPKELQGEIKDFIKGDSSEKLGLVSYQGAQRRRNSPSLLIGGSTNFDRAKGWGDFVIEVELPQEVFVYQKKDSLYRGENESYALFGIHPTWIKRILSEKGEVLWEAK